MAYLTTIPIAWDRVAYLEQVSVQRGCPETPRVAQLARCPGPSPGNRSAISQGGALVTFVGAVRADRNGGRTVRALFYDAYAEMAESLIHRLVDDVRARWALDGVQIQHRLGLVEAGQISVVVAAAAQHRAEAYAASQCLIEGIKHQVPIWKRELYDDGTSRWTTCVPELLSVEDPAGAVHAHV